MNDRFYNGFVSGIIGATVPFVVNFSTRALGLNTLVWADFMGLFILGRRPGDTLSMFFLIFVQFMFLGILGTLFSLILPLISSKSHLFKGALFGASLWFILFSLPNVLQLPGLEGTPLKTAVSNLFSASLWGITLAFILNRINNKVK